MRASNKREKKFSLSRVVGQIRREVQLGGEKGGLWWVFVRQVPAFRWTGPGKDGVGAGCKITPSVLPL